MTDTVKPNRILSATAIGFGFPTDAPAHQLDWKRRDETTGFPICKGCDKPIWAEQWVAGTCPGRTNSGPDGAVNAVTGPDPDA